MHIHILGICGTFMGGVPALARAAGAGLVAELRVQPGAGHIDAGRELEHALGREADVAVVAQSGLDQAVQHRVAEL